MLNFDFLDKGLGIVSPAHFVYDFFMLFLHVFFFKKHKFQKHETQNAEILRNIYETLPD